EKLHRNGGHAFYVKSGRDEKKASRLWGAEQSESAAHGPLPVGIDSSVIGMECSSSPRYSPRRIGRRNRDPSSGAPTRRSLPPPFSPISRGDAVDPSPFSTGAEEDA